jgi:hypothetical protein
MTLKLLLLFLVLAASPSLGLDNKECSGDGLDGARKHFKKLYDQKKYAEAIDSLLPTYRACGPEQNGSAERVGVVSDLLLGLYKNGEIDRCYLLGTYWSNGLGGQKPTEASKSLEFNLKKCRCEMLSASKLSECAKPKLEVEREIGPGVKLRFKLARVPEGLQLQVLKGKKSVQSITGKEIDESRPFLFQDMNFDSHLDLSVPSAGGSCSGGSTRFLYQPAKRSFAGNQSLLYVCAPSFDRWTKTVSVASGQLCDGKHTWYEWMADRIVPLKEVTATCGEASPSGEVKDLKFTVRERKGETWETHTVSEYDFKAPYLP